MSSRRQPRLLIGTQDVRAAVERGKLLEILRRGSAPGSRTPSRSVFRRPALPGGATMRTGRNMPVERQLFITIHRRAGWKTWPLHGGAPARRARKTQSGANRKSARLRVALSSSSRIWGAAALRVPFGRRDRQSGSSGSICLWANDKLTVMPLDALAFSCASTQCAPSRTIPSPWGARRRKLPNCPNIASSPDVDDPYVIPPYAGVPKSAPKFCSRNRVDRRAKLI